VIKTRRCAGYGTSPEKEKERGEITRRARGGERGKGIGACQPRNDSNLFLSPPEPLDYPRKKGGEKKKVRVKKKKGGRKGVNEAHQVTRTLYLA